MFITSKRQPKINSIRQYTKWPKLEIFSNFWRIKISLKNALELNFGTSKEFSSLFTWHWARSIFSNFWIFWDSWIFKNSKIIEIVFDRFLDHFLLRQLFKNFIFRSKNVQRIIMVSSRLGSEGEQMPNLNYRLIFWHWNYDVIVMSLDMTSFMWRNLIWRHSFDATCSESFQHFNQKRSPNSSLIFAKEI